MNEQATNTVLIALLGVQAVLLGLTVVMLGQTIRKVRAFYVVWKERFENWVSPGDGGSPSQMLGVIDGIASRVGKAVAIEAKTTLMGKSSGIARGEAAVQGALMEDVAAAESPLAGAILQSFPKLSKVVGRNPGLLEIALSMISKMGSRPAGPPPGNGNMPAGTGAPPRFSL